MSPHSKIDRRWLTLAISAGAVLFGMWGLAPASVGQGAATPVPDVTFDLLTVSPFDRMTLTDNTVVFIDPVLPRPLPPYDPAKAAKKKRAKVEVPAEGNIAFPGEKSKFKKLENEDDDSAAVLAIHLIAGEIRDYQIRRASVRSIDYFEDLLLAEADRLIMARDFTRAFECILRVQTRDPKWKGLDDRANRLLFTEGSTALLQNDGERGLRLLRELFARKPDFPGLADKLAHSYGARAGRAFELGLYARGRKILHDVEQLAPTHPVVRAIHDQFLSKAVSLLKASATKPPAERLDAVSEALRVWPKLEGGDAAYREAFNVEPTLDVAVTDIPRNVGPWTRSPADDRVTPLLYQPVLARDDEEALQGKVAGQLATSVVASDLGRRIVVTLRSDVPWSDRSRPVSAIDVARALTDAAEPNSQRFNARWADLLERVDVSDETHVEIRLTRATLKPGGWLVGPVGPAHGGGDGRVATLERGRELVVDGLYLWAATAPDRAGMSAAERSSSDPKAKIKRIKEVRYPNAKAALGAFNRGEVTVLEHVPTDRVAELAANADFRVGRYERPSLHRIALDGRTPALRNRSLRRGISYAIDRRTLLEETLLRRPPDAANLVADGPMSKGNYGDAPDVKPLGYDPLLAKMLITGARKELGGNPIKFTFAYPAIPEAQAVVPKIAEALKLVGIETVLDEKPESVLEMELRAGKRFDLAYRSSRLAEPVIEIGLMLCPAYDAPLSANPLSSLASPRILQLLLQLERAPEWPTAKALVLQIDRECRDELPVIPLWQLEDHYAWRIRLKGPAETADRLYQGIASWEIEPWFAKDPW